MPIPSAAALMAPPFAGAAIEPDEPASKAAPAIRTAEHAILMTLPPLRASAVPRAMLLNGRCDRLFRPGRESCGPARCFPGSRNRFARAAFAYGTARRRSKRMKRILLDTVAVVLMAGPVMAQAVVIAPEQRKIIKEYVVKEKIRPHKLQSRVTV